MAITDHKFDKLALASKFCNHGLVLDEFSNSDGKILIPDSEPTIKIYKNTQGLFFNLRTKDREGSDPELTLIVYSSTVKG